MTTMNPATSDPIILMMWLLPPPVRCTSKSFPPHGPCIISVIAAVCVGRREGVPHIRAERFVNTALIDAVLETLPTVETSSAALSSSLFARAASSNRQVDSMLRLATAAASSLLARAFANE